ncbi:Cut9 interacting protein Scn1, putative [Talaromyces stipitatus ATCC 10500]|uniref:Cut9 interacting protein Scn1, putative n=1 Tax=Talaromyces stipitatus (strain ATCC 10500 / CBS 375.48 / QM 6759 / NRRL 1006) TaxID=441959 RepID=B8MFH7_TALSN|nr:Cut9 interacting protein Scn1, putative [Talaromyces stipitatus ATCC 10500]EED16711.1 Cut9 interacting protein Scn1, putative [Talaromyces stipitatus ATCC 10500]
MADKTVENNLPFPWNLGVFDAHCHPTDTMTSISDIPHMNATALTVMSTRGEDQELVDEVAKRLGDYHQELKQGNGKIVPCFGWHPWFAHQIRVEADEEATSKTETTEAIKIQHYRNALTGSMGNEEEDNHFFNTLPTPKPLSVLLEETKTRLSAHPNALVGEVGLDKAFRLPMPWQEEELEFRDAGLTSGSREGRKLSPYRVTIAHQKALLKAQLQLAGQLRRAVSVHSVQGHGAVLEVFQELWKGHERKVESSRQRKKRVDEEKIEREAEQDVDGSGQETELTPLPYPPRICMHSYSGSPEAVRQLLRPSVPSDVYFSFSTVINFTGPSVKWVQTSLESLPDERILIESDLHTAGKRMDDLLEEVVRTVCRVKGWSLEDGTRILAENWRRCIYTVATPEY